LKRFGIRAALIALLTETSTARVAPLRATIPRISSSLTNGDGRRSQSRDGSLGEIHAIEEETAEEFDWHATPTKRLCSKSWLYKLSGGALPESLSGSIVDVPLSEAHSMISALSESLAFRAFMQARFDGGLATRSTRRTAQLHGLPPPILGVHG
jgi:hypothetical protein